MSIQAFDIWLIQAFILPTKQYYSESDFIP